MSRRFPPPLSTVFLGFAVLFWLAPFFWAGWKGKAWASLPKSVTFQHTAAGLFTRRCTRWWDQHIEAHGIGGQRFEISERAVFGMGAFGFRTRYDRILIETNRSRLSGQVRRRLAEHVLRRLEGGGVPLAGQNVGSGRQRLGAPVKSLQLVRTLWTVGDEALANPAGEWHPPPVTEVKGANRQVLGTYQLVAGKVVEIPTPRTLEVPETPRLGTDLRLTSGTRSDPRKRPLVMPAPASGLAPGGAPSIPVPWRRGSVPQPARPEAPVMKAPNAGGSNRPTLPYGANLRPGQPSAPPTKTVPPPSTDNGAK